MSNTASRKPMGAPRMLADALLKSMTGTTAYLRVTNTNTTTSQTEIGLVATTFYKAAISPVVMRKLRPDWQGNNCSTWELLVSATGVEQQVNALNLESAQSLFAMTLAVTVAEQNYLIESISMNEAFGEVYLYRLLLREAIPQAV